MMTDQELDVLLKESLGEGSKIIVYNDDVNNFQHVISCFVSILGHDPHQAEQCAYIIHMKGKSSVKEGSYEDLEPLCNSLTYMGLSAQIE